MRSHLMVRLLVSIVTWLRSEFTVCVMFIDMAELLLLVKLPDETIVTFELAVPFINSAVFSTDYCR